VARASITGAIGTTTQAVTKRRMDPYGNLRGGAVSWPGDRSFLNKPLDATGLTSIGARYYDALIGRFVSVDPVMDLGSPQQWAAYSYADNNPIAKSDPTGLLSIGSAWKNVTSAVSRGASATSRWVRTHQAEIVGGVVGAVVTGGCLAASGGVGSVGCAALGGAAAGAATNLWKSQVQGTQRSSWGSLAMDTGVGAVSGGLGKAAAPALRRGAAAASERVVAAASRTVQVARRAVVSGRSAVTRVTSGAGRASGAANSAVDGMVGARTAGVAGEQAAGIIKNTQRIPSLSGTASFRIPDELTSTALGEVKNVVNLSYTNQLRDFAAYAQQDGPGFNLHVALQDALSAGQINLIRNFP
jgi:RHS repeat-associated protein